MLQVGSGVSMLGVGGGWHSTAARGPKREAGKGGEKCSHEAVISSWPLVR
jgi:hypothetical protein